MKIILKSILAVSMTSLSSISSVSASVTIGGTNGINIDASSATASAVNSIAIGTNTTSSEIGAVTVGLDSQASGVRSVAIGQNSNALQGDTIAIGTGTKAMIDSSVAIGHNAEVTGTLGIAVGNETKSTGQVSSAFGLYSKSSGAYSTAVGGEAEAVENDAVAIGSHTVAKDAGSLSVGSYTKANGRSSTAIGSGYTVDGRSSGAIGYGGYTNEGKYNISGNDSYAIGNANNIARNNTFVLGNNITASQNNSVILGNLSTDRAATTESNVQVNGVTYGTFAGQGSAANGVVSVGDVGKERQIINVAAGKISETSTDAINGSQLYLTQQTIGNVAQSSAKVLGGNATVNNDGSITVSNIGDTGENTVHDAIKSVKNSINNNVTNITELQKGFNLATTVSEGEGTTSTHNVKAGSTVTFDAGKNIKLTQENGKISVATKDDVKFNTVKVGNTVSISEDGINAGDKKVTNVANGENDSDAVNMSQLRSVNNTINKRVDDLGDRVHKNRKRNDAGIAGVAAMSTIPQVILPGKSGLGIGAASRHGQGAMAIGYSRASDNGKHIIKLSGSYDSQRNNTVAAGYMYQW
ncbi:autotransporter adhesin [Pasteurella langaaensis DSM 22999]|uniref:Autotransporter adhesin n=1 Tax=Alitibacter langaaensis DSM 22999 TaxID=1122935 RepID=A0A2U0SNS5_9PAST|nr:YadA-like family protein [Pasteurella langaaensis]PVX32977.1 autotransporter adhesin [Pasteurella langaaensis DSM 22999]